MVVPITSRKHDLAYVIFFVLHLVTMLLVDLGALYPLSMTPSVVTNIRTFYISTYKDRFFYDPPAWFVGYVWMEALLHLPFSLYAIPALIRDDPYIPIYLLIWAVQTAVTTLTCIMEFTTWGLTADETISLSQLYVPYLLLAIYVTGDMVMRVVVKLRPSTVDEVKKVN